MIWMKPTPQAHQRSGISFPLGNRDGFTKSSDLVTKLVCLAEHAESSTLLTLIVFSFAWPPHISKALNKTLHFKVRIHSTGWIFRIAIKVKHLYLNSLQQSYSTAPTLNFRGAVSRHCSHLDEAQAECQEQTPS